MWRDTRAPLRPGRTEMRRQIYPRHPEESTALAARREEKIPASASPASASVKGPGQDLALRMPQSQPRTSGAWGDTYINPSSSSRLRGRSPDTPSPLRCPGRVTARRSNLGRLSSGTKKPWTNTGAGITHTRHCRILKNILSTTSLLADTKPALENICPATYEKCGANSVDTSEVSAER